MSINGDKLAETVHAFVREGFEAQFGRLKGTFKTDPLWTALHGAGSRLWLDTGSMTESSELWDEEFEALTTNNTLLNQEVQRGQYDELVVKSRKLLEGFDLTRKELMLEIAFILNAVHGLKLVAKYDALVSVEEHTDLASDVAAAVEYGKRYHAVCPERFIVKIPLTPAGLLATRRLANADIPVNHTLGFSARQNYVVARLATPAYVNVFLGRLNSFVADNKLGDGSYVGEKAMLASQSAIAALRAEGRSQTRHIAASLRNGGQIRDLAGVDILTMPPKAARDFLTLGLSVDAVADRTGRDYKPGIDAAVDAAAVGLDTLWNVSEKLVACMDALEDEDLDRFTPQRLVGFFNAKGCGDVLVDWTEQQVAVSAAEGKIPVLENWSEALRSGTVGLDALMNLGGLNSFIADQAAMDQRVAGLLK